MQHCGLMSKLFKTEIIVEIQRIRRVEVCGKVVSEKMANRLLKRHCYCPMILMLTQR